MPFKLGQSGNPKGRPRRDTSAAEVLRKAIEKNAVGIINAMAQKALDGDVQAATLLLNRIVPVLRPVEPTTAESTGPVTINFIGVDAPQPPWPSDGD